MTIELTPIGQNPILNSVDEILLFARLDLSIVQDTEVVLANEFATDEVEFIAPEAPTDRSTRTEPLRKRAAANLAASELWKRLSTFLGLSTPPKQILSTLNIQIGCVLGNTTIRILGNDVDRTVSMADFFDLWSEQNPFKIDTPSGWENVGRVIQKPDKNCYTVVLKSGLELQCSDDHYLMTDTGWESTEVIEFGSKVITRNGTDIVVSKTPIGIQNTYDIYVLSGEHAYYSNGIVSRNTDFPTQIDLLNAFGRVAQQYRDEGLRILKMLKPITATIDAGNKIEDE